jgi:hypothetical protein
VPLVMALPAMGPRGMVLHVMALLAMAPRGMVLHVMALPAIVHLSNSFPCANSN